MSVCCPTPQALMRREGATLQLRRRLANHLASALAGAQQRAVRLASLLGYLAQHPDGRCPPALLRQQLPWLARRQLLRLCIALLLDLLGITALVNVSRSLASLRASKSKVLSHDGSESGCD